MKPTFYTLMHVQHDTKRRMNIKTYSNEEYIDIFVKNACILDKTLITNGLQGGGNTLNK